MYKSKFCAKNKENNAKNQKNVKEKIGGNPMLRLQKPRNHAKNSHNLWKFGKNSSKIWICKKVI